jgi:hypothetical protein
VPALALPFTFPVHVAGKHILDLNNWYETPGKCDIREVSSAA